MMATIVMTKTIDKIRIIIVADFDLGFSTITDTKAVEEN
jgi:hypothetical protein